MQALSRLKDLGEAKQTGDVQRRTSNEAENIMFELGLNLPKEPIVEVLTTENRGFTVEEIADRCLKRIIAVSQRTS